MSYVELHTHSWFSYLDGVCSPEQLVRRAAELGMRAIALTDHNTLAGVVRFCAACRQYGLKPIVGAEITIEPLAAESIITEPSGPFSIDSPHHLVLLAPDPAAYRRLCRILSAAGLRSAKGRARVAWDDLASSGQGLIALTACLRGEVSSSLLIGDEKRARRVLGALRDIFRDRLFIEISDHGRREERRVNAALLRLSKDFGLPALATQNVHYSDPSMYRLHDVVTCIRHGCTLDGAGGLLRPSAAYCLRSPEQMTRLFARRPELPALTAELAASMDFSVDKLDFPMPRAYEGDQMGRLKSLVRDGMLSRYGSPGPAVERQARHELRVIERLGLAGYFLVVHDIVRFARDRSILVQGRGSAANSVVCYCLGITAVEPVGMGLLFERFLSEHRGEPPDIDIDIQNDRREEVIQYVYQRYGRRHAAMVGEVISYHIRSAVRDVSKVLGMDGDRIKKIARRLSDAMGPRELVAELEFAGFRPSCREFTLLVELAGAMRGMPRHPGVHVGGMVVSAVPLDELTSLEQARMPGRSVVPWDKDDCNALGLVKIDLLGLGMLALLARARSLLKHYRGIDFDLARVDHRDPLVYDLLCEADTVGVFQVESRAQMATLPRVRPRCFYDIVIEVALVRPGPLQGDMVHPYLRRRSGEEAVEYIHPLLKPHLERTLGIPLFQEQCMKIAVRAAGFTPAQADELRRAMGHKRSARKMSLLRGALLDGMTARGIPPAAAKRIVQQLAAFSGYGFPESHAAGFALLVLASAYLKVHHPLVFYASLLNSQPMGFYPVACVISDALRHGVEILGFCARKSGYDVTIEDCVSGAGALRLGWRLVHGFGRSLGLGLENRARERPFESLFDFVSRSGLPEGLLLKLARLGAFSCFDLSRKEALWNIKALLRAPKGLFRALQPEIEENGRVMPDQIEDCVAWEYAELGFSFSRHPVTLARASLGRQCGGRLCPVAKLRELDDHSFACVAGIAVIRQRPPTAKGMVFISLEDESGMGNVIMFPGVFKAYRRLVLEHDFLVFEGVVERRHGIVNLRAVRVRAFFPFQRAK